MKITQILAVVIGILVIAGLVLVVTRREGPAEVTENVQEIVENYQASGNVSVAHWWTIDVEEQGFRVLKNKMEQLYPNMTLTPVPVPGGAGGNMPPRILPSLVAGTNIPGSFQSHPGYETARYGGYYLRNLNDLWEYANIAERVPAIVEKMCKLDGNYYLVPVGVHRTNVVFYNKQLLQQLGIDMTNPPRTWEEFFNLCDLIKQRAQERGLNIYPLEVGDGMGTDWAATQIFETIMAGYSLQTYEKFINGTVTAGELEPILQLFKRYLSYVPDDHRARNWAEACGQLFNGRVAMYVHGDWANAYFEQRGWTLGVQYDIFLAPGTENLFGLVVDGFVVPKKGNVIGGLRWVYSYTTLEVQSSFNPVKGSVSPYRDVPDNIYTNSYARNAASALRNPQTKFYPSFTHGIAIPNEILYDLHPKISEFVEFQNVSASASTIASLIRSGTYTISWDIV
ncbi:MAG: ABC transporter substrate-binding protein [Candidatus Hadarchaeales archaeon]